VVADDGGVELWDGSAWVRGVEVECAGGVVLPGSRRWCDPDDQADEFVECPACGFLTEVKPDGHVPPHPIWGPLSLLRAHGMIW
jgi:hypothetical protein